MRGLTDRQEVCLKAISDAVISTGVPPTFRELGTAMGGISSNAVYDNVRALERKGFISRRGVDESRGLRLTEKAQAHLGVACPLHTEGRIAVLERVYAAACAWADEPHGGHVLALSLAVQEARALATAAAESH